MASPAWYKKLSSSLETVELFCLLDTAWVFWTLWQNLLSKMMRTAHVGFGDVGDERGCHSVREINVLFSFFFFFNALQFICCFILRYSEVVEEKKDNQNLKK